MSGHVSVWKLALLIGLVCLMLGVWARQCVNACCAHWAGVFDVPVYVQQLQGLPLSTHDTFVQRTIMRRCMVSTDVTCRT